VGGRARSVAGGRHATVSQLVRIKQKHEPGASKRDRPKLKESGFQRGAAGASDVSRRSPRDLCVNSDKLWRCQGSRAEPAPLTKPGHLIIRLAAVAYSKIHSLAETQKCPNVKKYIDA